MDSETKSSLNLIEPDRNRLHSRQDTSTGEAGNFIFSPPPPRMMIPNDGGGIRINRSLSLTPPPSSPPLREVNEFGVNVGHVTIQSYRDRQGRYRTTKRKGIPSKGEKYVDTDRVPQVTFFHAVDEIGNIQSQRIEVDWWEFSEFLESLEEFPLAEMDSRQETTFFYPFVSLFLRLDALERESSTTEARSPIAHNSTASAPNIGITKAILGFLGENASEIRSRFDALNSANPSTLIQYDNLWMLYKPGQLVFAKISGLHPVCYMVDYPTVIREHDSPSLMRLELRCWDINYNARVGAFTKRRSALTIDRFHGGIAIAKLVYVPERFVEDPDAVKAQILARGQHFWEMNTTSRFQQVVSHQDHGQHSSSILRVIVSEGAGSTMHQDRLKSIEIARLAKTEAIEKWSRQASGGSGSSSRNRTFEPAVNVNPAHQEVRATRSQWFHSYDTIPASSKPDDLALMLCPHSVVAFSLRDKSWGSYHVASLKPVEFATNAWSRLVLKTDYKEVIWAMVKSYMAHSTGFQDLVEGKGDGLVILLHGPPGVGKTLTAECVAESFKKPLYMVTAGDLGTDPETLESKLSDIFNRAVEWDAILLLDEAHIFLQDRDYDNLQRNALVSIFLRTLEYFNGIMFLTSNRVGAFDQAFQSRIHITIGMPEFDEALRKEVWKIFIKDLGRPRRDGSPALLSHDECRALGSEVVNSWASQPLNGRQIRNCVRSALALAENKGTKPNASHFNNVIKLGNAFTQYMNKLQKAEAEEIAQIKGDRLAAMKDLMARDDVP
ncbi:ATPase [Colletotrichum orchidophilum]|uniref:ATPase n=1 Tax=Colletotrichum orchidophilum TaxID=1209926 RepID=A0A1G4BC57_9PEZI|nr:ATPase [Colletotrichum orchidophilum]OHE98999.1 ATPase [Colletotrichum orchidophilum]